jgi:DNA-binding Lrp family transcriptional regulator
MKDIELRLISELMKNSRRSDRELAKALGISQPTVSRVIKRLKEEGVIKEETIIADFSKLGIELLAVTFGVWSPEKIKAIPEKERIEKAKKFISEHPNVIFASSGRGLGKERMIITIHRDYADYGEFMKHARTEWAGLVELESFIISLKSDVAPFPFSLKNLGTYVEKINR